VSPDGEKVIWLIRSTAGADAGKREVSLRALNDYASADVPEAVNFIGFVNEYGCSVPVGMSNAPARSTPPLRRAVTNQPCSTWA